MAEYCVPYGTSEVMFTLPDTARSTVIAPREVAPPDDIRALVAGALDHPLGGVTLDDFAGARSVAITISDKTRPLSHDLVTVLLERLAALGIPDAAITLLIATGTHTPMPPEEFGLLLPDDIVRRYRMLSHDCDAMETLVHLGTTDGGTPVYANRHFVDADLRIVVGNLEPHQFMGFSGGVKAAAIGVAGRETIDTNHALMTEPNAELGHYADNPMRQDLEQIGRMMGIQFALNAILNRHKQVVRALTGDPLAVMQAGVPLVRELVEVPVAQPFDLVITSPGGHPKDINLYQAQKALAHAARVTRDGGHAILVAACGEGPGSALYEDWVTGMSSHEAVIERFKREDFRLGPHKAFQIARDALRLHVQLVSEMDAARVKRLLLTPADDVQAAIDRALRELPAAAQIGIFPAANSTIPALSG